MDSESYKKKYIILYFLWICAANHLGPDLCVPYHHRTCEISCTVPPLHPEIQYSIVKKTCTVSPLKTTGRAEDWRTVLCSICLSSLNCSWEHKHKQRESKICVETISNIQNAACTVNVDFIRIEYMVLAKYQYLSIL